jgi:hypothetical protein
MLESSHPSSLFLNRIDQVVITLSAPWVEFNDLYPRSGEAHDEPGNFAFSQYFR